MKIYIQHRAKNNVCDLGEDVLSVRCVLRPVKRYFWPLNFKHGLTNGRQKTETKPHVAEHHEQIKHNVDWDSAECITYCTITTNNARNITLESWYTTGTTKPIKTTTGTLQKTYSQHGPNKETILNFSSLPTMHNPTQPNLTTNIPCSRIIQKPLHCYVYKYMYSIINITSLYLILLE